MPCPTSPTQRSPVGASMLQRQGLRRPLAKISGQGCAFVPGPQRGIGGVGIVGGDRVAGAGIGHADHADAKHLPEQAGLILRQVAGVATAAPVAETEVEVAVVAEGDVAPVVVVEGLIHGQQDLLGRRRRGRHVVEDQTGDARGQRGAVRRIGDEDLARRGQLGWKARPSRPPSPASLTGPRRSIQVLALPGFAVLKT